MNFFVFLSTRRVLFVSFILQIEIYFLRLLISKENKLSKKEKISKVRATRRDLRLNLVD
jgi:hypothetical protein